MTTKKELLTQKPNPPEFNASEAVYAFVAWLTTRKQRTIMSATDSASLPAELVEKFCKHYNLPEVRPHYTNLITPVEPNDELKGQVVGQVMVKR